MLHAKFRPPVPEKKSFEGFLPYIGMAAILVKTCDLDYLYTHWFDRPSSFREEDL